MTELHEIQGFNKYCGPSVLSALTGRSTDTCAAVISAVTGAKTIKAVQIAHLIEALKRIEFMAEEIQPPGRTVFGCLNALSDKDGFYIINVPRHVIAIEIKDMRIYLIDNHTKHAINAHASARLTQTVEKVYRVVPKAQPSKDQITADRIQWLNGQINMLNSQISIRLEQRTKYEQELQSLKEDEVRLE